MKPFINPEIRYAEKKSSIVLFVNHKIGRIESKLESGEADIKRLGEFYQIRAGKMDPLEKIHFFTQIAQNMSSTSKLMQRFGRADKAKQYSEMAYDYYLKAYGQAVLTKATNPLSYASAAIHACPGHEDAENLAINTVVPAYLKRAGDLEKEGRQSVMPSDESEISVSINGNGTWISPDESKDLWMHKRVNSFTQAILLYEQAAELVKPYSDSIRFESLKSAMGIVRTLLKNNDFYSCITQSNLDHALVSKQKELEVQLNDLSLKLGFFKWAPNPAWEGSFSSVSPKPLPLSVSQAA